MLRAEAGMGSDAQVPEMSYWSDGNVLKLDCGSGYTTLINTLNISGLYT